MRNSKVVAAVLVAVAAIATGCANDDTTTGSESSGKTSSAEVFDFGEPADASDATTIIDIAANDDFSYTPDSVKVSAGDVVTFRVTNSGNLNHEFTLGDESLQQEHEQEMKDMGDMQMGDDPNAISIASGETGELTWKFSGSGDVLMGCHVAGHYDGGMRGKITVAAAA